MTNAQLFPQFTYVLAEKRAKRMFSCIKWKIKVIVEKIQAKLILFGGNTIITSG
jgi:hypothetical protein